MIRIFRRPAALRLAACLSLLASGAAFAGDGCKYPYVWREAFDGDHVCVTPDIRAQARRDNEEAPARVNQVNHDYGPDTCVYGFVWREANPSDHVCVTPDVRARARADNAAAPYRYASSGGGGSVAGGGGGGSYNPAWQAAPGDHRCCPHNMLVCPLGRRWC